MAEERCLNLLKEIEGIADFIRISSDSRLRELFEMAVTCDNNRLDSAKVRCTEAKATHDAWVCKTEVAMKKLKEAEEELERARLTCEQLKSGEITSSSSAKAIERLKQDISRDKALLAFYKEATGVRFDYNSPHDVISGYVAVKGSIPRHSKLVPFALNKSSRQIPDIIWGKISEAVEDIAPSATKIVNAPLVPEMMDLS